MPALHSPTHCQAAQAKAKTQAWQRVCLPVPLGLQPSGNK